MQTDTQNTCSGRDVPRMPIATACLSGVGAWSQALIKSKRAPFCLPQDVLPPTLLNGDRNTERLSVSSGTPSKLRARKRKPLSGDQFHDQCNNQSLNSVPHSPSIY